jgi:hypothetical protein
MSRALAVALLAAAVQARAGCDDARSIPVSQTRYAAVGGQAVSAIAVNDSGAFGVWRQTHAGFSGFSYIASGAALTAGGSADGVQRNLFFGYRTLELASDGRNFLLAGFDRGRTAAVILDDAGQRISDPVFLTSDETSAATATARVVWNGSAYIVFTTTGTRAVLAQVSREGRLISTRDFTDGTSAAAIAPAGPGRVLAIWRFGNGVHAGFFSGVSPEGSAHLLSEADGTAPEFALASGDGAYVLAWRGGALRLDGSGMRTGSPIAIPSPASVVRVVWERPDFLLLWTSGAWVAAARVRADGGLAMFTPAPGELSSAAAAPGGTIILTRSNCGSIRSSFLRRGETEAEAASDVSILPVGPVTPAVASTRAGHQVVWSETLITEVSCSNESRLLTAFVGDGRVEQLNTPGATVGDFAAAPAGDSTLVVWTEYAGGSLPGVMRVARLDAEGRRQSTATLIHGWFFFNLSAAWSGSRFVVVWGQQQDLRPILDVYAAVLSESGEMVEGPVLMSQASDDATSITAGAHGSRVLIAYRNRAETVAIEIDGSLRSVRRHDMLLPDDVRSPIAAGIREDAAVIIAPRYHGNELDLVALDPSASTVSALALGSTVTPTVRLTPRGSGWALRFAAGDTERAEVREAGLSSALQFGEARALFCLPAPPWGIGYGTAATAFVRDARVYLLPPAGRRRAVVRD